MPTETFNYTGSEQTWTVPNFVSEVTVECWGAGGGDVLGGGPGGAGGYASGFLSVSPGETLRIYVGEGGSGGGNQSEGEGGWNGGGDGGGSSGTGWYGGGGGGGASDVRQSGDSLSDRVAVAGGGGGGGGDEYRVQGGGQGGGSNGGDGVGSGSGGGGTQSSGGSGYDNGELGNGGIGEDDDYSGGGGGGGYYGGGGSEQGDGGGGGSGYTGGVTSASMSTGGGSSPESDGQVVITYTTAELNLPVTNVDGDENSLDWDPVSGADGYRVLRAESSGSSTGDYTQIADTTSTSYDDTGLEDGERYYYRIEAYDDSETLLSNEDDAVTTLPAGSNSTVEHTGDGELTVSVMREDNSSDGEWQLYRSTDDSLGSEVYSTTTLDGPEYADTGVEEDTVYHYTWRRSTDHAESDSTQVNAGIPTAPSNVEITNADTEGQLPGDTADVAWTDNTTANDGYRVKVSRDGGQTWQQDGDDLAADATTHTTSALLDGEEYTIGVLAFISTVEVQDST